MKMTLPLNTQLMARRMSIFENMRRAGNGRTIVVISHQERILNIADEIVVIKDGAIVNRGSKDDVLPTLIGTSAAVRRCEKTGFEKGEDDLW